MSLEDNLAWMAVRHLPPGLKGECHIGSGPRSSYRGRLSPSMPISL